MADYWDDEYLHDPKPRLARHHTDMTKKEVEIVDVRENAGVRLTDSRMREFPTFFNREDGTQTFELVRRNDESGVSGTGMVLVGCIWPDASVSVRWMTKDAPQSTVFYGNEGLTNGWEKFLDIHVNSHATNAVRISIHSTNGYRYYWDQPVSPLKEETIEERMGRMAVQAWNDFMLEKFERSKQ